MRISRLAAAAVTLTFMAAGCSSVNPTAADPAPDEPSSIRVATFNASLNRPAPGQLVTDLQGENTQARAVADVIAANSPDVLLVNEFDYSGDDAVRLFNDNYLDGQYRHSFTAPVNTGVDSGLDLDKDGALGGPGDAWGFGQFPGQYGMVVYSKFPIATESVRTFQNFLWKDMPDSLLPRDYYGDVSDALRLSSKSHWDVPIDVNGKTLHVLASHPTPPSFDGPEDRNGKRNHDEIRMSADYISGADYLYDDKGVRGGLEQGASFVMLGDQNSDPVDGDSVGSVTDLPIVEFAFPGPLRDMLVAAVLIGEKTSTASLLVQYVDEELPRVGNRGAVVDSAGDVVAVIETTGVEIVALCDVSLQHALDEGEGYVDVAHWRAGHERFWQSAEVREELGDPHFSVNDDTQVVLERFTLV